MNRSFASLIVLALCSALGAAAQTAPAAVPTTKVAVIAFEAAVSQTNEFQRNFADLRKKFEPKALELKKLADEVDTLTKQLQTSADKLSEAEQASRARVIEEKKKQAQRMQEDTQTDYQQEVQQTFGGVAQKLGEVLQKYAQQQGFTVVLDGTQQQQQAPIVLFASPSTDITRAVIDAYNVKSGVPAPATQAPDAK